MKIMMYIINEVNDVNDVNDADLAINRSLLSRLAECASRHVFFLINLKKGDFRPRKMMNGNLK